ncbi:Glycoside Hydrolase Family 35 protein [Trametes cinnabarina]|uniref:beta-galactosidase n=1 Tax=Pycnoporus cinnabarinus TaxID=5643 RepID=A0A060SCS4_PYCCI|nr:Glycoside Hydrolase Family 35 protein [Trametes cinnabarina]
MTHDQPLLLFDSKLSSSSPSLEYKGSFDEVPSGSRRVTASMLWRRYQSWALPAILSLCLVLLTWPASVQTNASVARDTVNHLAARVDPPRKDDGFTEVVQWDNYTLFLHGQRLFLHSGEFHTFRLPVPDLWLDIFQKMVAAGLNGVSIYIHMGLTNPAPGVIDFNDWRALQSIFDAAKLAGIFIVLRPGPYINAETTAGGIAHWATSLVAGTLRTNASDWTAAYEPYINGIIKETVPNEVTSGGPVLAVQVDNEYSQSPITRAEYFANLEKQYRDGGLLVPLTYNDPGMGRNFINGTGAVDIYGLDSYPQGFDCSNPTHWAPVVTNYHQYHIENNPSEPWYMPEFQGGSFDPWGGPGYDACEVLTGPDFQDVFYKQNWASNVKLISYYMFYGYDYGSSIRETRALSPKFDEIKRQGIFLRSSPEFRKTDWIGDSSTGIPGVNVSNSEAFITLLKNPDTGTGFFISRQTDSTSTSSISFNITVPTSHGTLTLPLTTGAIALDGRQSKVIVTDYSFGSKGSVLYSTASIFFAGTIGSRDVLFLFGDADQSHEAAIAFTGNGARIQSSRVRFSTSRASRGVTTVTVLPGSTGLVTIWDSDTQLVLFADPVTTATFWAPAVPSATRNSISGFEHFWQFGTNTIVLVGGPYLVRNASLADGGRTLALRGDLNSTVMLTVIAPPSVSAVTWNGQRVESLRPTTQAQGRGFLTGTLAERSAVKSVQVPELTGWKFADSLPEIQPNFDDSAWVVANHTTTNITRKPLFGDGRVLFGCDYGFCENNVLWRGHFNGSTSTTSVNLTINGGSSFAASVWINDKLIDTVHNGADQINALFTFPEGSVKIGEDNVVTVLQDHMGNDEDSNEKSARGIPGFQLNSGNFTTWKVQGKVGGYLNFPDKVRGIFNEGGLFGERQGWHLPGFDLSSANFTARGLSEGLPSGGAGVGFFVTTFDLKIPSGTDTMLSFVFDGGSGNSGQAYRALLFVNGWKFGKRVANVGPQASFPVPPGILDYDGKNTVAVALWALNNTAVSPSLDLVVDNVLDGGVGPITTNNPKWSPRPAN